MSRPVLLIAGGSRGIGAATAKLAAGHGYDVAVNYKNNSNAAASVVEAVKKAGGKAVAIQGDMALENDIERVFDTANDTFGSLTHFVHSSGIIGECSRLDEVSATTIREVLGIDTFGALLCLRACVRRMSTKHGGKGRRRLDGDRCFPRSCQGRHPRQRRYAWRDRYRYSAAGAH